VHRIALQGCDGAHGVYIDPVAQHAFVACEHNARLVTVDLRTSGVTSRASVGSDPDVLAFDPELHRLYVASESGTVTVFDTADATARKIAQGHLADHAHTVAVDQASHRVYFPLEDVHGRPILRVTVPTPDK
jgi:DNA-binding beta-propeller fold protein YncE